MSRADDLEARLHRILASYGKLALLIEDAPDAELRTARELYGADGLPLWWVRCDNLEEGARAAAALVDRPDWARDLPLLVLLDRYLPSDRSSTRAIPWDDQKPEGELLRRAVAGLRRQADTTRTIRLLAVSSYVPNLREGQSREPGEPLPWEARHEEPLFRLRQTLQKLDPGDALRSLLTFGPAVTPPLQACAHVTVEDHCRARLWHRCIEDLAAALGDKARPIPFLLLTGAGASLANHPLAPGIPPTWFLLDWAGWSVSGSEALRQPVWPADSTRRSPGPVQPHVETLKELVACIRRGESSARLSWTMESLLTPRKKEDPVLLSGFLAAFRQTLQQWDHDFPYHTWLLAQIPWTLVLTTNFDGFHERAAASAAAAASPEVVEGIRRLGDLVEESAPSPSRGLDGVLQGAGLFKPYGSLMRVGSLAVTQHHFWDRVKQIEKRLDALKSCKRCWLVIIGHRLASQALTASLERLLRQHTEMRVLWVDPAACSLAQDQTTREYHFGWKFADAIDRDPDAAARQQFLPLPVRALDFVYDLWNEYSSQSARRPGG